MDPYQQRTQSKTPHKQTALDRQIDRLVYDLYGLTPHPEAVFFDEFLVVVDEDENCCFRS